MCTPNYSSLQSSCSPSSRGAAFLSSSRSSFQKQEELDNVQTTNVDIHSAREIQERSATGPRVSASYSTQGSIQCDTHSKTLMKIALAKTK